MELPDAFDCKSRNQIEIKMLPASARRGELVRCTIHRGTQLILNISADVVTSSEHVWPEVK